MFLIQKKETLKEAFKLSAKTTRYISLKKAINKVIKLIKEKDINSQFNDIKEVFRWFFLKNTFYSKFILILPFSKKYNLFRKKKNKELI